MKDKNLDFAGKAIAEQQRNRTQQGIPAVADVSRLRDTLEQTAN